jgi:hypothetical protein
MINTDKLTLLDGLAYALEDIKATSKPEIYDAFSKWFGNKPHYLSSSGKKCILVADLQLYIRLRTNALQKIGTKK